MKNSMDYKKEIIEIIEKIESEKILRYIYLFLVDIPKKYWRQIYVQKKKKNKALSYRHYTKRL